MADEELEFIDKRLKAIADSLRKLIALHPKILEDKETKEFLDSLKTGIIKRIGLQIFRVSNRNKEEVLRTAQKILSESIQSRQKYRILIGNKKIVAMIAGLISRIIKNRQEANNCYKRYGNLQHLFGACDTWFYNSHGDLLFAYKLLLNKEQISRKHYEHSKTLNFTTAWNYLFENIEKDKNKALQNFALMLIKGIEGAYPEIIQSIVNAESYNSLILQLNEKLEVIEAKKKEISEESNRVAEKDRNKFWLLRYFWDKEDLLADEYEYCISVINEPLLKEKKKIIENRLKFENSFLWESLQDINAENFKDKCQYFCNSLFRYTNEMLAKIDNALKAAQLDILNLDNCHFELIEPAYNIDEYTYRIPALTIGKPLKIRMRIMDSNNKELNISNIDFLDINWSLRQPRDYSMEPEKFKEKELSRFRVILRQMEGVSQAIPEDFTIGIAELSCSIWHYNNLVSAPNWYVKIEREAHKKDVSRIEKDIIYAYNTDMALLKFYDVVGVYTNGQYDDSFLIYPNAQPKTTLQKIDFSEKESFIIPHEYALMFNPNYFRLNGWQLENMKCVKFVFDIENEDAQIEQRKIELLKPALAAKGKDGNYRITRKGTIRLLKAD